MKTPQFWQRETNSLLPFLLAPAACLYGGVSRIHRSLQKRERVSVPVICIGNVVAGGAGKTPVAVAVARLFLSVGKKPHFLSRGYGGSLAGPTRVVLDVHTFREVGDEPLILAETAPTWIAKDRAAGARAAEEAGADVIIMDDGFQNPTLIKDLSLLVLDADYGVGNGRLIPAGPLRESLSAGLRRSDAAILVGKSIQKELKIQLSEFKPVYKAKIVPRPSADTIGGEKVVAFAGIGRPEKFFTSLRESGCELIKCFSYADHHIYEKDEIMVMVELAATQNAVLVTTRKDYVRLPSDAKMMVTVFDVDMAFEAPDELQSCLLSVLKEG